MTRKFTAIAVLVAVVITGCGGGPTGPVAKPTAVKTVQTPAASSALINGAGATFPYPLYSRWFFDYASVDSTAKFNYQSIGSGGGIKQIKERTVDFAGSDAILSEKDYKDVAPARLQMLPIVAGAVVPAYSLQELAGKDPLNLDGAVLAGIFLGQIRKWNDPSILALNPGVALPAKDILIAHRSDGSGTTSIFTDYLSAVSPDWKTRVGSGTSVKWPAGLGGKGNEGVAGVIQSNDGALGYVELAFAKQNELLYARMKNSAGTLVTASVESVQAAMADFGGAMPDTLARSIVNAPGKGAWPIAGYTYLIIYMDQKDCGHGKALAGFIRWALDEKASAVATSLDYVPLPESVRRQVLATVDKMTCGGRPL